MKRFGTGNETKRSSGAHGMTSVAPSSQRLAAAGLQILEAHARVRRFAERLGKELESTISPRIAPTTGLDPKDPMVIAVEKVIAVTSSMAAVSEGSSTKLGGVQPSKIRTKLGIGPPSKPPPTKNEE